MFIRAPNDSLKLARYYVYNEKYVDWTSGLDSILCTKGLIRVHECYNTQEIVDICIILNEPTFSIFHIRYRNWDNILTSGIRNMCSQTSIA